MCSIDPNSTCITLAKLQNPIKTSYDEVNGDLRAIDKAHKAYGRALKEVTKMLSPIMDYTKNAIELPR